MSGEWNQRVLRKERYSSSSYDAQPSTFDVNDDAYDEFSPVAFTPFDAKYSGQTEVLKIVNASTNITLLSWIFRYNREQ